ncbi:class I SAM-dependent methyltransferase [Aquirufa sp. ROCK-SH2]
MDKGYYKYYFDLERNHWWFQARNKIIFDQINDIYQVQKRPLKILNVGVATGATSELLSNFGTVTSVEYDQDCIDFVTTKIDLPIFQGDICALDFPENTFDLVCALDVVEHVDNDELAAIELTRVCKHGGSILITVPSFKSLWGEHDVINHHFKRYKSAELLELFKNHTILNYKTYFNFWLFLPIWIVRNLPFKLERKNSGSDFDLFKSSWMNKLCYYILASERFFISRNIQLPFGVSALGLWTKK